MEDMEQHFLDRVDQYICVIDQMAKDMKVNDQHMSYRLNSHICNIEEKVERMKHDYQIRLDKVTLKKYKLKTKLNEEMEKQPGNGSPYRVLKRDRKMKRYYIDLDNAKKEKSRLKRQIAKVESLLKKIATNKYFPEPAQKVNIEFPEDEIECLDVIGAGRSGSVYKACLRKTVVVAIKKLNWESMQESEFIRKVAVLGRVRHPNLVTLIGVCKEGLVYEFVPNGSLQDHLVAWRNGSMLPLKWQVRIKIIREIWMVLTFLHSSKPPLVHGNLKPSNVLLDYNFACKVEAFGISQSNGGIGKPTKQHDVHSFGIIALQLLMAWLCSEKDAVKVVDEANKKGELDTLLKTTAWDWPLELAKRLAHIGLRCVARRDDLAEELRQLFEDADGFAAASEEQVEEQAPGPLTCPISGVLMVDPHIAADGHTYSCKDINKWFFTYGMKISPVTRQVIEDKKVIPNRFAQWMIEDWMEKHQGQVRTLTVSDPNPPVQSSHPTIPPAAQSQPPTDLHPTSRSLTLTPLDASAETQLQLQPPPASSSPPTTLMPSTANARSRSSTPVPLNTSAASVRSHRLNPTPQRPSSILRPPRRRQPTGIRRLLHPDPVTSSSLTPADTSAEARLQLPPAASSNPPTTLILPTAADARSSSTAPVPLDTPLDASARSHRLNPLPVNPGAAAPPPPRPVSSSSTDFSPTPNGIRRRRVNDRLPSSSMGPDVPAGPGETSRIRGKMKDE